MSLLPSEPPSPQRRRDLLAPLGVILIVSGIVIAVLGVIMKVWAATLALALVYIGCRFVLIREYPDQVRVDDSWFGGPKIRIGKDPDEGPESKHGRTPPRMDARSSRNQQQPARRGCRLMTALNERRGRS